MQHLWQKDDNYLHPFVASFTAGDDWRLDNSLLPFDCLGSIAHADTLRSIGILSEDDYRVLKGGLQQCIVDHAARRFMVTDEYEDCHTAIESRLIAEHGEVGKRIHSGRSRNDQVFCALLLYGRHHLIYMISTAFKLAKELLQLAKREEHTPMMGRTHLQNAMPSTVGVWAAAYAEQLLMLSPICEALYRVTNRSPLGSAAGYGVPLPLDREHTARLLGFDEPHHVVLAAANSRGHWEAYYLDTIGQIMMILSRLAGDLMLFTLPEIGYMRLPAAFCTGSSIMPHKRNPDLLELIRAKAAAAIGLSAQVKQIMHALPAGYNRDLQETKPLLISGVASVGATLSAAILLIEALEIDRERLAQSIDPHVYSVDYALRLVREEGVGFRDAYHRVAAQLDDAAATMPSAADDPRAYAELIAARSSTGAPGNLKLAKLRARLTKAERGWGERWDALAATLYKLTPAAERIK